MLFDSAVQEKVHKEQTYAIYRSTSKVSHLIFMSFEPGERKRFLCPSGFDFPNSNLSRNTRKTWIMHGSLACE